MKYMKYFTFSIFFKLSQMIAKTEGNKVLKPDRTCDFAPQTHFVFAVTRLLH